MRWLVTGGAGYIGAHVVTALRAAGTEPVVLDNLSTGHARRLPAGVPLVRADVRDGATLGGLLRRQRFDGVIHLAARKDVAESTAHPLRYYEENLDGLRSVLHAVATSGTPSVLFSSSAAVYGTPPRSPVSESDATTPDNAYGRTKLIGEWMLRDAAGSAGFGWCALRYFNVAGAGAPHLRDHGGTNLVPRLLRAAADGRPATVYGTDYPTPDGTAVRDYVHVADIADAHVRAAVALHRGEARDEILNIGRGEGASVLQMIEAVGAALGRPLPYTAAPRRAGDPAQVVASPARIRALLGWQARHDLHDIVTSAAADTTTHAATPQTATSQAAAHRARAAHRDALLTVVPEQHPGPRSKNQVKNAQR
ncbi:UDP-glucose 4-epimerase GalE [Dactylosporangium aurantiacum]|uniref:UDP-glucose 4-epimerase n=1 Tax=Dactylosporangium aurantiacum TaxID=35754 RepID=A0A9Q9MHY0_9ACTN|nr:UDP-glucose 4-epimerase GalE [Dactylosporangium aurantiacum]MDG6100595.1 UDP-glucose 4-epimerase GalE [Dactylosporangium aurantiacum]UWZ55315.1 UDP-glucose 4-epimerase GalE [Dactylosporangium aurantiacum]